MSKVSQSIPKYPKVSQNRHQQDYKVSQNRHQHDYKAYAGGTKKSYLQGICKSKKKKITVISTKYQV